MALVYDGDQRAYGLDAPNKQVIVFNLERLKVERAIELLYVPSRACYEPTRNRLYITNWGDRFITEVNTETLQIHNQFRWTGRETSNGLSVRHYNIECQPDRLLVTDASHVPVPLIIDLTTAEHPQTHFYIDEITYNSDRDLPGSGVGEWVFTADDQEFYYWYQFGWDSGWAGSYVIHVALGTETIRWTAPFFWMKHRSAS